MLIAGRGGDALWLTVVFVIHLLVFSTLLLRRRQKRYIPLVLTFALLLAAQWLPRLGLNGSLLGWSLAGFLRGLGWTFGALALVIVIAARIRERRTRSGQGAP